LSVGEFFMRNVLGRN